MVIKFGEIDASQILDNEYRIKLLYKLLDWILKNNRIIGPPQNELERLKEEVIKELQEKYPNSGIKLMK